MIPVEFFDRSPETRAERRILRQVVRRQLQQIRDLGIVTCPCGHHADWALAAMFRCYYCGVVFCRKCAARHFETEHRRN